MTNEKRLVYDSEFKWRINAIIRNRKRMGLPYDQLESVALGLIDLCPTVDAVEVVRCKDCKHWQCWRISGEGSGDCHLDEGYATLATQHYDFCSYGERKDNDA